MGAHDIIFQAIKDQRTVYGMYDGEPRFFCPHRLGLKFDKKWGTRTQKTIVWQYAGSSSTGPVTGSWKCFDIAKLSEVALVAGDWQTGPVKGYQGTCVDQVEIEVPY